MGGSEERERTGQRVATGGAATGRLGDRLTSTGELVGQQHQVDGAGAARGSVALHDADVGAAAVVPGARMVSCRRKQEVRAGKPELRFVLFGSELALALV